MKETEKRNTEQAILQAAEAEFLPKGFEGARTTSIAEAAGVTHAMLHYYFRTKQNLFDKFMSSKIEIMRDSVLSIFANPELPLLQRIEAGIIAHFRFIQENPWLPRFMVNEIFSISDNHSSIIEKMSDVAFSVMSELQKDIDKAYANGEIEHIEASVLVADIVSLNVFTFIHQPFMFKILQIQDSEKAIDERLSENIKLIMRRLKKS